jgi:tetratricopeptide (TPR) repeat protein
MGETMNAAIVAKGFVVPLIACGAVLAAGAAKAQDIPGYPSSVEAFDRREIALLPPYCVHTMIFRERIPGGNNPEVVQRWRSLMGPNNFDTMHHYCWGLMKTNRATLLAKSAYTRQFYLNSAVSEFDYVLERVSKDFILLPEVLTKKGENLVRLGKGPAAMFVLERAAEVKPDYWPSWAQMADYYKDTGDTRKAREVLEQALSFSPDAAALKRRLAELDSAPQRRKGAEGRGNKASSSQQGEP